MSLLNTLVRATRDRKVVPAGDLARIGKLVASGDDALREAAVRAIGTWKVASLQNKLVELVGAADTSRGVRAAAIEALVHNGGAEGRRVVEALDRAVVPRPRSRRGSWPHCWKPTPGERRRAFVAWLGRLYARPVQRGRDRAGARSGAARSTGACWPRPSTGVAPTLSADLAKLCIRQVRASGRDEPGLIAALEKAGRLKEASRKLSDKEMNQLLTDVSRTGDPARGEAIFRRKDLNCQKCHAIAGAGGQVGPGLESIGASAQPDYLVDSLLEPGKAVKENYHALVVATSDGKVYTGIKLRQTDSELVLRDAEDREVAIPTSSIEEQKMAGSLMPAGLTEVVDPARADRPGPVSVAVGQDRPLFRGNRPRTAPLAGPGGDARGEVGGRPERRRRSGHTRAIAQLAAGLHDGGRACFPSRNGPSRPDAPRQVPVGLARSQLEVTSPGKVKLIVQLGAMRSRSGSTAGQVEPDERFASLGDPGPDARPAHDRRCRRPGSPA